MIAVEPLAVAAAAALGDSYFTVRDEKSGVYSDCAFHETKDFYRVALVGGALLAKHAGLSNNVSYPLAIVGLAGLGNRLGVHLGHQHFGTTSGGVAAGGAASFIATAVGGADIRPDWYQLNDGWDAQLGLPPGTALDAPLPSTVDTLPLPHGVGPYTDAVGSI